MVATLVPNKRPRPADAPDAARPSPACLLTAARDSFKRTLLDYYSSHHSFRYPTELTITVPPHWSSSPHYESDVRALLSSTRVDPNCELRIRTLDSKAVTIFSLQLPLHPKNNLGLYLLACDLSYVLRIYVNNEESHPRPMKTSDWPELRTGGDLYVPEWSMFDPDTNEIIMAVEVPRGFNQTNAEARLKAAVTGGKARIGLITEVQPGLTQTDTTTSVTSFSILLRIFTLNPKKMLVESYNSGIVTYSPDSAEPTPTPEDIIFPLAPFVLEKADRSRKSLSLSIGGDVIVAWAKALYEEEVHRWQRGIR